MKPPDLGEYTQEETLEIAVEAMGQLTLEQRVQAVLRAFDADDREELMAHLEDPKTS